MRPLSLVGPALLIIVIGTACERPDGAVRAGGADGGAVLTGAGRALGSAVGASGDVPGGPERGEAELGPEEIYYDLTAFEWYRRGEPLRAGGRAFVPEGTPLALPDGRLRPAGRYGGVTYYAAGEAGPPPAVLFVPVFKGYWQPFVPEAADAPPETAD